MRRPPNPRDPRSLSRVEPELAVETPARRRIPAPDEAILTWVVMEVDLTRGTAISRLRWAPVPPEVVH